MYLPESHRVQMFHAIKTRIGKVATSHKYYRDLTNRLAAEGEYVAADKTAKIMRHHLDALATCQAILETLRPGAVQKETE